MSATTGEFRMKKSNAAQKEPSLSPSETGKGEKGSDPEIVGSLIELSVELRKKEASKPLYLARYE